MVFFSSLAILVLVMSFLEILLLTRKIRMTKSLSPPKMIKYQLRQGIKLFLLLKQAFYAFSWISIGIFS